jgi:hypothetical protein
MVEKKTTIKLPEEVKKDFQKECVDRGLTMQQAFLEAIKLWLKK